MLTRGEGGGGVGGWAISDIICGHPVRHMSALEALYVGEGHPGNCHGVSDAWAKQCRGVY